MFRHDFCQMYYSKETTMPINTLPTYLEVLQSLLKKKRTKHLLFGNGFSMSYDPSIFSYNALSNFIENIDDDLLKKLFSSLNTKNFESIMQQLDNFVEIAEIFSSDKKLAETIKATSTKLKTSLIDAVKELHPEHVFSIPEEKSKACYAFLGEYLKQGCVFSTNYDLLPYWALMRNSTSSNSSNSINSIDGFGRELISEPDEFNSEPEYSSELIWGVNKSGQNVFYLHGTLPVFDSGVDIIKEVYDGEHYLLENIKSRIEKKEYPIFVTAGNAKEKLTHIMHNRYLSYCFEQLCSISGSLVTFGFNFGDYDTHIIDAINTAAKKRRGPNRLWSIYIGVYSDSDIEHIERIKSRFKVKVNLYNARTANIWGS
jgi:hypothetical protein